jgi:exosortase
VSTIRVADRIIPSSPNGVADLPLPLSDTTGSLRWAAATFVLAVFAWSYWPVLGELWAAWEREPDYSHGYLVIPVSLLMLWTRRSQRPALGTRLAWGALALVCMAILVRAAGSLWYVDFLQAWSIPLWLAGACWFLAGWRFLRWTLPAIAFLGFMIPLPFRAEMLLSQPLQSIASRLSCALLQVLGQPAIREGNVVVIHDVELAVVEACSGLRIFMSIVALAFAYFVFVKTPWWVKVGVFVSVLPVALITNAMRIALTGLLHIYVSGEAAHRFSHDFAGWLMIPAAAAMMAGIAWYLSRVVFEVQAQTTRDMLLAR